MRLMVVLAVLASMAPAGAAELLQPADPVPGHPGLTHFDLLKQVVLDLALDADGTARGQATVALRSLVDGGAALMPEAIEVSYPQAIPFRVDGKELTLLYATLGRPEGQASETVLLALYDEAMQLIDAADVGVFENNWVDSVFAIGAGDDAVRLDSEHFNSSQGYDAALLVHVRERELSLIDTIYTFTVRGGDYDEEQSLSVAASDNGQPAHWPVTAKVHATRTVEPQSEPGAAVEPPYDRTIAVTYAWSASAQGYVADSEAFVVLNAENEGRY